MKSAKINILQVAKRCLWVVLDVLLVNAALVAAQFIVLFASEFLITVSVLCLPQMEVVSLIVATVLYALMIMIFCVRMQMCYLDRTQTERADLKTYYHY